MNWKITYDEQRGWVNIVVEGIIVAQKTAEMAIEGISFAREKNCRKFLIDYTRADVGDSTIDTYEFMAGLEKLGISHRDSIAIVHSKDSEEHHFAETVALNRGWDNIKYFFDVEKATIWLLTRSS